MANVTLNVTDNKGQAAGSIEAPADFFGFSAAAGFSGIETNG